jgi:DNA invertase Pin-like site-specific DNA recombinase
VKLLSQRGDKVKKDKGLAIVYARVSTNRQGENGHSLKGQADKLTALAEAQGYRVEVVSEIGSGRKASRPKLLEALEKLNKKEAQALFAQDLDRLARSTKHALEIADTAQKKKWRLVISTLDLDTASPVGEMLLGQLAIFAQFESRMTSERVKRQHEARRARGIVWGVNEGYKGNLKIKTRKLILELSSSGIGLGTISKELTKLKHETPRGGEWHKATIRAILNSPQTKALTSKAA